MTRTLVLIRHGKSDWSVDVEDRERPLAPRGRRQAPESGRWLAAHGPRIDLALVSPARRARDTWDLVAAAFDTPPPSRPLERVYTFDAADLRDVVAEVTAADPGLGCVALVGHDPGLTDLLGELLAEPAREPLPMPTSAVAVVDLPHGWADWSDAVLRAHGRPPPVP